MKYYLILLILIVNFSCEKESELTVNNTFEVTVVGKGIDCPLTLIDFRQEDLIKIGRITGSDWSRYHAFNLDENFNQVGQVITVTVRKTNDSELFPCTTLGPGYPWVTILKAEEKD